MGSSAMEMRMGKRESRSLVHLYFWFYPVAQRVDSPASPAGEEGGRQCDRCARRRLGNRRGVYRRDRGCRAAGQWLALAEEAGVDEEVVCAVERAAVVEVAVVPAR